MSAPGKMAAPPPPPPPPPPTNLSRLTDPEWLEAQATRDALIGAYRQGRADRAMEFIQDLEAWAEKAEFATWALAFQWLAITLRAELKLPAPTPSPPKEN